MDSHLYPIYAKDSKDVPDWMKASHEWQSATPVDKLPKLQMKVKLCCLKCEEKVIEEIQEVPGVFDVKAERLASKVVVVAMPHVNLDDHEVLRRARKIHRKAKFVELDAKEKPKKDEKKKDDDDKKKPKKDEKKKDDDDKKKEGDDKKKEQQQRGDSVYSYKPMVYWGGAPIYIPQPTPYYPGEYRPSQNYPPRYHYPPLPNQPQDGYYRQYVYKYL